jgi:hypothetical protein
MKKSILVLSLVLLTSIAFSQKFTLGPLAGFNSSKLTTNFPDIKEQAKANFLFGAFLRFGEKVYLQPEVVYTTKGGTFSNDLVSGAEQTIKLNTLEIPAMIGFRLINIGIANIRIMGGPMAGIIINKDVTFNEFVTDPIPEASIKDLDWAIQLGAGLDILFLTLDVRYEIGLTNLYEAESGQQEYDMKNNLWRISLGWKIL